jgi:hypothetical protein
MPRLPEGPPYRCVTCGVVFPGYGGRAGWEAHSDASGHHRGEICLGGRTTEVVSTRVVGTSG